MIGQIIGVSKFRYLLVVSVEQCAELCCAIFIKNTSAPGAWYSCIKKLESHCYKTMHLWSETVKSSISKEDKSHPGLKTRSSV